MVCNQGCIKCIRSPAMAMDQIEFFCPFPDWLKNILNIVFVTHPKTEVLKSKGLNVLQVPLNPSLTGCPCAVCWLAAGSPIVKKSQIHLKSTQPNTQTVR